MMGRIILSFILLSTILVNGAIAQRGLTPQPQIMAKFKADAPSADVENIIAKTGATLKRYLPKGRIYILDIPQGRFPDDYIKAMEILSGWQGTDKVMLYQRGLLQVEFSWSERLGIPSKEGMLKTIENYGLTVYLMGVHHGRL